MDGISSRQGAHQVAQMFTRTTWPLYLSRKPTVSLFARSKARKSGARVSTATTPPLSVRVRTKAPMPMAPTIAATRIHCLDMSGLHGAGAPQGAEGGGGIGLPEDRLARDEGVGPGPPGRGDGVGGDPAVHF